MLDTGWWSQYQAPNFFELEPSATTCLAAYCPLVTVGREGGRAGSTLPLVHRENRFSRNRLGVSRFIPALKGCGSFP